MHKRTAAACLALIMLSAACVDHTTLPPQQRKSQPKRTVEDRAYQALAAEFLDGYFTWRPQTAVTLGFHEYDGKPEDLLPPSLDAEHARLRRFRDRLAAI